MSDTTMLRCVRPPIEISVVIPIHDELENLGPLLESLDAALAGMAGKREYVLVDDGSTDGSGEMLDRFVEQRDDLVVVHLRRCFGQTAAIEAGIRVSRGDVLVFMDADLQNDPADIPSLLARLEEGYDVVHGWRKMRQDVFWSRRFPSLVANRLIRWVTGVKVNDLGCALRVIRRDLAEELPLEGEMHRFIAVLADARGARWSEMPVRHHPRRQGASKYGLSRTFKVAVDLVVLCWFTRLAVPMTRLLVGVGLLMLALAPLPLVVTAATAITGREASWGSSLGIAVATGFGGINLLGIGIVAATTVSTWWRSRNLRPWSERTGSVAREERRRLAA